MSKKATLSDVRAKGSDRIEFDFLFEGIRYRPTLRRTPSEANLRRAYKQLEDIKNRIDRGEFNFSDEFPDYRYKGTLTSPSDSRDTIKPETCDEVADKFSAYCELRVSKDDMAPSTLRDYQEILQRVIRALTRVKTLCALPRHATRDSSHVTEPCGRYPFDATNYSRGWGGRIIRPGRASPLRGRPPGDNTTEGVKRIATARD
jgi:hypothetical protein